MPCFSAYFLALENCVVHTPGVTAVVEYFSPSCDLVAAEPTTHVSAHSAVATILKIRTSKPPYFPLVEPVVAEKPSDCSLSGLSLPYWIMSARV